MQKRMKTRIRRNGFTILELLIVIGILLAIGGLVLVNLLGASDKSDIGLTQVQINTFKNELMKFRVEMKRWPTEEEGLAVLWSKDALANEEDRAKYTRPYLAEPAPRDRWGREWIYRQPSTIVEGADFDVVSLGPDGEEGTEDDITNHTARQDAAGDDFSEFSGGSGASGG
ncbi:MAG: type II secretion system protein GspG [Phycisphaera sp.]|nr:type II secretion system protein GspG [Phycisphaera sp.]